MGVFGQRRKYGSLWTEEKVWNCLDRGESIGGFGQRRFGSVWTEEKIWECFDRGGNMAVFGLRGKYGSVRTKEKGLEC